MKKVSLILCVMFLSIGLVACNTFKPEEKANVLESDKNTELNNDGSTSEQTELSKEVENEDFKLIVKSEKQNFSSNKPIVFTAELHYKGPDEKVEVYSNSSLIDYQILSEDGTFDLKSEGEDFHNTFVIAKDQPHIETFEFDKSDKSFGKLLETMVAGNYTIKVFANYGKENILDQKNLETELNFKIND